MRHIHGIAYAVYTAAARERHTAYTALYIRCIRKKEVYGIAHTVYTAAAQPSPHNARGISNSVFIFFTPFPGGIWVSGFLYYTKREGLKLARASERASERERQRERRNVKLRRAGKEGRGGEAVLETRWTLPLGSRSRLREGGGRGEKERV